MQGREVLSGITWQLKQGEHWAIIGGNGAGKSTLLKLIRGELWPDSRDPVCTPKSLRLSGDPVGTQGTRQYCFNGELQESPIGVKKHIAIVSAELQDAYHRHHWNMSGLEVVYTGFFDSAWLHQAPADEQKAAAERVLQALKLNTLLGKNFLEMSQGEARKILIARALVSCPAILALDEPCSGLDFSSRRKLLRLVEKIAATGTTVLYVTHRIEELIPSITHVLILSGGKIIAQGEKNGLLSGNCSDALLSVAANSSLKPVQHHTRMIHKGSQLIRIRHADVFLKRKKILRDISWVMRKGEHWAVIGRNGAGKSTLLKLIAGDLYPALGGEVHRFGAKDSGSVWDLRKRIGIVSPDVQHEYSYGIKGIDAVVSGFFSSIGLYDEITSAQIETARYWMEFFDILQLSERSLSSLSYGEQRKILVARAMVNSPDILILDEPCSGLDSAARAGFLSFITQIAAAGVALIMTTHRPDEIPLSFTHIMVLDKGKIIAQGKKGEFTF